MEKLFIGNNEFMYEQNNNVHIVFSTAKNSLNFNIDSYEGQHNISNIKTWFSLDEVGYLRQTHSSNTYIYDGKVYEGDAIITNRRNVAVGVFTADCVPVLMVDDSRQVIAAVHSGWKGTLKGICADTVSKLVKEYSCRPEELKVYIGPHNRSCCYEIGQEVEELFIKNELYKNLQVVEKGKLNMELCIMAQLKHAGIREKNINTVNVCTFCCKEYELHSYRKSKTGCGRMFSFIFIK